MDQRFDFDENDSFLTRMRQRFDTYRVPIWQRPAFWGGILIVIAGLFAVTLLVSGLNKDKSETPPDQLPLLSADGSTDFREAPTADPATGLPTGSDSNLFDAMQAGDTPPADGQVLTETNGLPLTREQIAAQAAQNAGQNAATAQPGATGAENLLAPKTDPLQGTNTVDDMADGVMEKNGVKVIAENKVNPGSAETLPVDTAPVTAAVAPSATDLLPADGAAADAPVLTPPGDTLPTPDETPDTATDTASDSVMAEPSPVVETPSEEVPTAPAAAAGDRFIQLASIKEESAAAGHWDKLKAQHGALISGMAYRVVKAEIPGKGTYFRIQAGPVAESKAKDVCATLNASSAGSCIVVKP